MRNDGSKALLLSCVLMLAAILGCRRDDGPARVPVRGTVTLDGNLVEDGQIRYVPIDGTLGSVTIARVIGGKYVCDDKGGVPVGMHRVEIFAWDPKAPYGGRGEPPRPQWVPPKYNENSELRVTIEDNGNTIERDFDLQ